VVPLPRVVVSDNMIVGQFVFDIRTAKRKINE
jgi:hypothetical protein